MAANNSKYIMDSLESARIEYERMQRLAILSGYTFPSKPSKDGIYRIYVSDPSKKSGRKQLSSSTLEGLKDKVYGYERRSKESKLACQKTVRDIFLITQDEKLRFVKSEEKRYSVLNTINRAQVNYNRFFKDTDFEKMTIASVTKNDLEDILLLSWAVQPEQKILYGLKGILKPIFDSAFQEYWIDDNPYARINFKKFSSILVEETPIEVTEIINKTGGNVIMASQLFGHSPEVAKNHYYVGLDLDEARKILEN